MSGASLPVEVRAFAKINITLRVLGIRHDGYHELRTVLQSVALHDRLIFEPTRGAFEIASDDPACPVDRTNLVWRAAALVWRAAGRRGAPRGVRVTIEKRIPIQAGLGGGSSDAAAALRVLSAWWHPAIESTRLHRMAARPRRRRAVLPAGRRRPRRRARRPALFARRLAARVGRAGAARFRRLDRRRLPLVRRADARVGRRSAVAESPFASAPRSLRGRRQRSAGRGAGSGIRRLLVWRRPCGGRARPGRRCPAAVRRCSGCSRRSRRPGARPTSCAVPGVWL